MPAIDSPAALLQQLVRIPSVNPDNTPATNETGEAALAAFLADLLDSLDADVILEEILPGRPNLTARFAPLDERPRILFGPHLDTVGTDGMTVDPFAATEREGKIYGRGSVDTKGPMAAMLWALHQRARALPDLPVAVDFVAFMGEESGQWGSKHFALHHAHRYAFAIIGEPTSLDVVNRAKGSLWATLRATGIAAHGSQPDSNNNAVIKLARAVVALDQFLTAKLASFVDPVLGPSTINVGTIHGGTRPNIVPDLATAELDIRTTPTLAAAGGAIPLLKQTIAELDLPVELVSPHENPPMLTRADHPVIQRILAVRPQSGITGAPWFSDASHLAAANLPSICLGPGSINQAHTADEFISVTHLFDGARFFTELLDSFSFASPFAACDR